MSRRSNDLGRREFLRAGAVLGAGAIAAQAGCCDPDSTTSPLGVPWASPDTPRGNLVDHLDAGHPNVLLIFNDQHRADAMGCAGNPVIETPNLDALAAQGVTFGRCCTNAPLCRPARASMMTGLYPHRHGVGCNMQIPDPSLPSHVRHMRDAGGYRTAVIGKTHLHRERDHLRGGAKALHAWGFDHVHEIHGTGQFIVDIDSDYTDWLDASTPTGEESKLDRFRDYMRQYRDGLWKRPWELPAFDASPCGLDVTDHLDWYTARKAAEWLAAYDEDRPFYLQLNMHGPHDPFDAVSAFRDKYSADDPYLPQGILEPPGEPVSHLVSELKNVYETEEITPERLRILQTLYYAKVTQMDAALGIVLEVMRQRGMLDDTWIIYTSDHGELLGDHRMIGKGAFFESSIRVPLIVRPPGGLSLPRYTDALTQTVDIPATVLSIAGLEKAPGPGRALDRAIVADEAEEGVQMVIGENLGYAMLRTSKYKLVLDVERGGVSTELYDLEDDPWELTNRVGHFEYAQQKKQMKALYEEIVSQSQT